MKILDGRKLAEKILKNLKKEIREKRLKLKLAVIFVGKNPGSKIFIKKKQQACQFLGIDFELFKFSSKIRPARLKEEIKKIAEDPGVSAIIVQLPLPEKFNTKEILDLVPSKKNAELSSPVVCAVSRLLKEYKISLKNKNIVLVGRGRLVGRPLAAWLRKQKLKFSNIDKSSTFQREIKQQQKNINVKKVLDKIKRADIVISGVGKPNLIRGEMVKRGAVVIDVGTSFRKGRTVGDVDFETVSQKAGYISPVPGGIGPLAVACLLEFLTKLNR